MDKWAMYWMLHCIGFAGFAATLIALPYGLLPSYVTGSIGGCWFGCFMCLARWVVLRKLPKGKA